MYQSGRAGDEAKKRNSPAKSGRVGIYEYSSDQSTERVEKKLLQDRAYMHTLTYCPIHTN